MRLDEIGENLEHLKSRAGQADTSGPMDVDNVSGSEKDDEDWVDVKMMPGTVQGNWKDEGNGHTKGKGKAGNDKKDGGKLSGYNGGAPVEKSGEHQEQCWACGQIGHNVSEC